MHIGIEHHDKSFNIALASKEGNEPFMVLKGCRIVDGSKGRFISVPSKKLDSGKYWTHAYISEQFQVAVLKAYDDSTPKPRRTDDSDIPF